MACSSSNTPSGNELGEGDDSGDGSNQASDGDSSGTGGSGSGNSDSDAASTAPGPVTGGIVLPTGGGVDVTTGGGGARGDILEDECDGVDNDNNGVIDDVDVGLDGICDCLRIGTLGLPGEWGQGDVFDAWLNERSDSGAVDLGDAELTAETLEKFQVIVVQDVSNIGRDYTPDEVAALSNWAAAGGGLMTLIGYTVSPAEVQNVNRLLEPFGVSYSEQQILQSPAGMTTTPVTEWGTHPVSDGVDRIGVHNGYPIEGGATIAGESGFVLLSVVDGADGRVAVWGDEWITYNSEWTEHPDYQVELFWLNTIKWLTPKNDCQVPIPDVIK